MKYCRSKDGRIAYLIATLVLTMCLVTVVLRSWNLLQKATDVTSKGVRGFVSFSLTFFIVITFAMGLILIWKLRKYELAADGISVAYIPKYSRKIPWGSISEVAVCRVHFSTRGGWDTVIRVVVGPEIKGPSHGDGPWSYQRYSIKNQNRIIIIDYSEARLQEFMAVCPLPIQDYR